MEEPWPDEEVRKSIGEFIFDVFMSEQKMFRTLRLILVIVYVSVAIATHMRFDSSKKEEELLRNKFKYELWFGTHGVLLTVYSLLFFAFIILYVKRLKTKMI